MAAPCGAPIDRRSFTECHACSCRGHAPRRRGSRRPSALFRSQASALEASHQKEHTTAAAAEAFSSMAAAAEAAAADADIEERRVGQRAPCWCRSLDPRLLAPNSTATRPSPRPCSAVTFARAHVAFKAPRGRPTASPGPRGRGEALRWWRGPPAQRMHRHGRRRAAAARAGGIADECAAGHRHLFCFPSPLRWTARR